MLRTTTLAAAAFFAFANITNAATFDAPVGIDGVNQTVTFDFMEDPLNPTWGSLTSSILNLTIQGGVVVGGDLFGSDPAALVSSGPEVSWDLNAFTFVDDFSAERFDLAAIIDGTFPSVFDDVTIQAGSYAFTDDMASVPLPASALLLLAGLGGLGFARSRQSA